MSRLLAALFLLVLILGAAETAFRGSPLHDQLAMENRYSSLPILFAERTRFDPEIAVLGDSSTMHDVRPAVIEKRIQRKLNRNMKAFNLGQSSGAPIAALAWVDYLLGRERPPKLAVLHVSPFMFSAGIRPGASRESITSMYTLRGGWYALLAGMPFEDVMRAASGSLLSAMRYRRRILELLWEGGAAQAPAYSDDQGWVPGNERIPLPVQQERALARARGYAAEQTRPTAWFDFEQYRYLDATIRRLKEAGVGVVLVTTPVSSPLWANDTDKTTFPEYLEKMRRMAARHQIAFYDHRRAPVLRDFNYFDGDHLNPNGALRYTAFLTQQVIIPFLAGKPAEPLVRWGEPEPWPGCSVLYDFEEIETRGWSFQGPAFDPGVATGALGAQPAVTNYAGMQLLNTFSPVSGDMATGTAVSPAFEISAPYLRFSIGGGNRRGVRMELLVGDRKVMEATGNGAESLTRGFFDVRPYLGDSARLRIVDEATELGGHLLIDQIALCEK